MTDMKDENTDCFTNPWLILVIILCSRAGSSSQEAELKRSGNVAKNSFDPILLSAFKLLDTQRLSMMAGWGQVTEF